MSAPNPAYVPVPFDGSEICGAADFRLFFPTSGQSSRPAKRVCARCPKRQACLDYAMARPVYGVWGGTTEDERRAIAMASGRSYNVVRSGR